MFKVNNCPKCGYQPEYQAVGDFKQFLILQCPKCGYVAAKMDEARSSQWGARLVWNRRTKNG